MERLLEVSNGGSVDSRCIGCVSEVGSGGFSCEPPLLAVNGVKAIFCQKVHIVLRAEQAVCC